MEINLLEWLGYLASLIVLISLLMSSIKKLRWINLIGSSIFAVYGLLIGSIPVVLMNIGISVINIYYLILMYRTKEFFKILPIEYKSDYLKFFLDFHKKEIAKFTGLINPTIDNSKVMFFVLRNMIPAGVFICSKHDDNTLKIELDFAVKQYRDFRIGSYIFESKKEYFMKMGYDSFICYSDNPAHINYLKKMGFELQGSNDTCYIKRLTLEK